MQQPLSTMFDDDDDVEPQIKAVDQYYFEHSEDEPACFCILPLHFDNNKEVVDCDSIKKVYLRGVLEQSPFPVHKRVVAWRVELDRENPKIFVLSCDGNWITILRARRWYSEKFARSVLITVQTLHFFKKQPEDNSRQGRLWDHLYEVFSKLDDKPNVDDLRKHRSLIKVFVAREPALMKSKMLQRLMKDSTKKPKTVNTKAQLIVGVELSSSIKDNDDKKDCDYSYKEHDSDDEYRYNEDSSECDCSYNEDSTEDDCSYNEDSTEDDCSYSESSTEDDCSDSESSTEDDCSYSENNSNSDDIGDGDTDSGNGDGIDTICALCDDGGKLLCCTGYCKRSFHPRLKDGRESNCRTLGYTSAQLKEISDFVCKNCKYKQHQCFKCGELEPSDEINAKVFKCKNASCGHFYHPKCVAKLLEPDDGACELAKRIMSRMPFTCPVHWCFKCGKMEDKTQEELKFAVCRRCPKSYHVQCLPRNISFQSKGKHIKQRAWNISGTILIYCGDHRIYKGTAGRNHIKFPCVTEVSKTNSPVIKKVERNGTRETGIHQCPIKSTELPNKLCIEENLGLAVVNPAKYTGSIETEKGPEKHLGTSLVAKSFAIQKKSSCAVGRELKKRVISKEDNEISSGISHDDIARKRVKPSTLSIHGHTDQDIVSGNSLVGTDAGWARIAEDNGGGERVKISVCSAGEENGAPNKDYLENNEQNGVLDNLFRETSPEMEGTELISGKEGDMEQGDYGYEHEPVPIQEKDICICKKDSGIEKRKVTNNDTKKCASGSDHADEDTPQKPINVIIMNITNIQLANGCGEDLEVNGSYDCQAEQHNVQSYTSPETTAKDAAGDSLRNRRKIRDKETTSNKVNLNKNRNYSHTKSGSKDPCGDTQSVRVEACGEKNQFLANHKELDVLDCKLRGSGLNNPRSNGENVSADNVKCKFKKRTVPNRREKEMLDIRANSSNSHVGRNARKRLRNYSLQEMDHGDHHPRASNRHRYEQKCHANYSPHDNIDGRHRSPSESAFSPDFDAVRRQSPPYRGRQEHGVTEWCGHRGAQYVPTRRHGSPSCPRTPDDINYTTCRDNYQDLEYDGYRNRGHLSPPYTRAPDFGFHPRSPDIHPHRRMMEYGSSPDTHPHQRMVEYDSSKRYSTSHIPRRSVDRDYTLRLHFDQYDNYAYGSSPETHPHQRIVEYDTSRRYNISHVPRRSVDRGYTPRLHYDQYDNYAYGGFSEMDIDPVARNSSFGHKNDGVYRPGMDVDIEERMAMYGGLVSHYGKVSLTPKASGSVTEMYARCLERTNLYPIGQSSLHHDQPSVRRR